MAFKTATVQTGKVVSTQSNFPVYVDLDRLGITTLAEAQSVRVYADSAKTTEWAREIVSVTEMHVKVPSLTSTVEIFVDWDGVRADYAVGATYGRNAVWSDYQAVYHMNSTGASETDVTGNSEDLTFYGTLPDVVSGKLGDAQNFVRSSDDYMKKASSIIAYDDFTIQTWVNVDSWFAGNRGVFLNQRLSNPIISLFYEGSLFFRVRQANTAGSLKQINGGSLSLGTDYYLSATLDVSTGAMALYKNITKGTATYTSGNFSGGGFEIGRDTLNIGYYDYIDGQFSETRIRQSVLSEDWITTEYNNQNAESTFWGTWTDAGGGGGGGAAQAARRGAVMMM